MIRRWNDQRRNRQAEKGPDVTPLVSHSLGSLACGSVPRSYLTQSLPLHSSPPSDGEEWKEGKETAGIDLLSLRSLPGW